MWVLEHHGSDCDRKVVFNQAPPQKVEDLEADVDGDIYLDGRVYISGQQSEAAIEELGRSGVTLVVNTRTPAKLVFTQ